MSSLLNFIFIFLSSLFALFFIIFTGVILVSLLFNPEIGEEFIKKLKL